MPSIKDQSSILLSIFKRKGGEGQLTKIITDENRSDYFDELQVLEGDERPLIIFKEGGSSWLLITNRRIVTQSTGRMSMQFSELDRVKLAYNEEVADGIRDLSDFTRLILNDDNGHSFLIKLEAGRPFWGIYQLLHHLASINNSPDEQR